MSGKCHYLMRNSVNKGKLRDSDTCCLSEDYDATVGGYVWLST